MMDSFIPSDLAIAPNPFGLASNLKLKAIPIDAHNSFELWTPSEKHLGSGLEISPEGGGLLPEEAMLLKNDRPRLEDICRRLTWLLGATLSLADAVEPEVHTQDWVAIVERLWQANIRMDAIAIDHFPQAICLSEAAPSSQPEWIVKPALWHIRFLELQPQTRFYQAIVQPAQVTISYGTLLRKSMQPMLEV
jgi:hypothetical protein